ncbi:MAG TPA: hypothetical protein PL105_01780, partial [Caldilineaceae bacterium]|nr:hypothetical protein [Caldilineaceae bacterium]
MNARMTRRQMLKLTGILGASTVLAACAAPAAPAAEAPAVGGEAASAPAQAATEVVLMYQANEISDPEIEQYNADYAPYQITRVDVDDTRFFAMFASGEAPDLLRVQAPAIPQMFARGMLLNLQPFFDTSETLKQDDLTDVNNYYRVVDALNTGSGDLYGMVKDWAPDTFTWVNETVFEKAGMAAPDLSTPQSETDMLELLRAVTTKEGDQTVTMGFDTATGFIDRFWMTMAKNVGSSLYSEDFESINVVGNEAVTDAIAYFFNMAKEGVMTSPLNPSPAWFGPDFVAGRLAVVWTGYWFHGFVVGDPDEAFKAAAAEGKIKMYPNFTWKGVRNNPCVTATGAIASSQTKNPDATWSVFEWFMGKEPAQNRAKSGWGLPGLKSLYPLIPQESPVSSFAWQT